MPGLTREQIHKADLVVLIRKYAFANGLSLCQLSYQAGMKPTTLYNRLKAPGTFSLDEINGLAKAARIPMDELRSILTWGGRK